MARLRGKITDWDEAKGYGSVVADGRTHFLHHRDFSVRHKRPAVGDEVTFALGQDAKGRTCAVAAEHANAGGRLRLADFGTVVLLLVLPSVAAARLDPALGLQFLLGLYALMSVLSFAFYWGDKRRAVRGDTRQPESALHLIEFLGGWPGAYLAQRMFRHKLTKVRYQIVFWFIVVLHLGVALDALLDWRLLHAALAAVRSPTA